MSGPSSNDGGPGMNLQAAIGEINLPANFKIPQLPTFEGKTDPLEHLMAVGTQTTIIGTEEHLKCKLLSSTFKDAALRWYMNLPRNSISSCSDFHKKFVRQFAGSKHIQVTATSLFSIRQGVSETLMEYLARFSEATIKVSNPNQEMFVAAFQNGLKAGHFNESLAQKPTESMQEVMKRAECYIKGEESNAEKRSRDSREGGFDQKDNRTPDRYQRGWQHREREGWHNRGGRTFRNLERRPRQAYEEYSPLNSAKGHDTEKCYKLRDLIEGLIRSGHLRKFMEKTVQVQTAKQEDTEAPLESPQDDKGKETARVAVNTIAGGFTGGGESNSARK
ncbi:hypothetical protein TSUD_133830 [Trifolium subterraneum]|uniref:Retrotransposon gag domain-containing protein n=1 Tax=Trifolium subterraneum TaxID=3900 RepID=A0A2Z6NRI6_TRISU|nr:hypothetical protein TSUD_133830 [Trifolium subterraneum]